MTGPTTGTFLLGLGRERLVPETTYSPPGLRNAFTKIDAQGYARPWDEPGFGIQVDWDWVEKHALGVET
jgi:L-alanine-DL-glutamate epimerase-like enolase superfamily enzyme